MNGPYGWTETASLLQSVAQATEFEVPAGSTARPSILLGAMFLAACSATTPDEKPRSLPSGGPLYPAAAEQAGRAGWVGLDCTITTVGTAKDCKVTGASGPDFAASALGFAQHARYAPATHDGIAVEQQHHTFRINYTLPSRRITLNVECTVRASGEVRNCRGPINNPSSAEWQAGRAMLERLTVIPLTRNGKPVDDPNRAITLKAVIAPLPLAEAMPILSGDVTGNAVLACRQKTDGQRNCVIEQNRAGPADLADTARYQVEVAIIGVAPPPAGDFAE